MKKLYETRLLIYSFGLLLSSVAEKFITSAIIEPLNLDVILANTLSLIVLMTLFIVINVVLKWIIFSSFMSKKVFGKEYIEGRWIEFIYNEKKKITRYCDVHISYYEDTIRLSGTNYDKDFNEINSFKSKSALMEDYYLSYSFATGESGKLTLDGLGNIEFKKNGKMRPNRCTGSFTEQDQNYTFIGVLIEDKSVAKKLHKNFASSFREIAYSLDPNAAKPNASIK